MSETRHSLLVPCYRAVAYLPRLAEQIGALSPQFDEVLLVDDGSDDSTYEVATSLDLPITRFSRNIGPGAARNELARMAKGEWIHFLDADDLISPDFLTATFAVASDNKDLILCAGEFIDPESGTVLQTWSFDACDFAKDPIDSAFRTPIPTFCSLIRRSRFLEVGGFDESKRCWEDGDLHLRIAASGAKIAVIPNVLSTSPRHDSGASSSHLYCHHCRLEFAESYLDHELPIRPESFAREFRQLGELFLGAGEWKQAFQAFSLAEKCGISRSSSGSPAFSWFLSHLRPRDSQMLSATVRTAARRLIPSST